MRLRDPWPIGFELGGYGKDPVDVHRTQLLLSMANRWIYPLKGELAHVGYGEGRLQIEEEEPKTRSVGHWRKTRQGSTPDALDRDWRCIQITSSFRSRQAR